MVELLWFVAGAACAALVARLRHPRRPAAVEVLAAAPVAAPPPETRQFARAVADELASLASGVEVGAQRLVEAAPDRASLPAAAEAMLAAVQPLRTLHRKLLAFDDSAGVAAPGRAEIAPLLAELGRELSALQFGLEICHAPLGRLPAIAVPPAVARDALLFLCAALLRVERGATHLAIAGELGFTASEPRVQIEFSLEWIADAAQPAGAPTADAAFALELEAARRLIAAHGGELTLTHLPRRSVRAVVQWPAASPATPMPEPASIAPAPTPAVAPTAHRYGGALVLESDPSVRAMLASELKASGRAVFACADGASARTFLEATPDRFELLIVDDAGRLDGDDALGMAIRTVKPDLKIVVLEAERRGATPHWLHARHLQKPFGAHELRTALASILPAG